MDCEEILIKRLHGHHLLQPADALAVARDLCGVQAQFLTHAYHALKIRSTHVDLENMVKNWSIRGTMHIFPLDDLPLFLHKGRTHYLRPMDTFHADAYLDEKRKQHFADLIVNAIVEGIDTREQLKRLCENEGMTEDESKSIFNPWGGLIRALCESGTICHRIQTEKAYRICPKFEPMEQEAAQLELVRRYFTNYGPATVKDAAYFFGTTQAKVRQLLAKIPAERCECLGKTFFYLENGFCNHSIPECILLAGFDPFMLGYDKAESLVLARENIRDIFNLSGIVRPAILLNGKVAGWWNLKNRKFSAMLFAECEGGIIESTAYKMWPDLDEIKIIR